MKKTLLLIAASAVLSVFGGNPLEFREYRQTLTAAFASAEDARNAKLIPRALPARYRLAFSSRWDDSTPAHLKTHEIMVKNGIKGTFFLGSLRWLEKKYPDYCARLLENGCSIGLHTVEHPPLPFVDSHRQFREYMRNKIELEIKSGSVTNSQVLPGCAWWAPNPLIPESIGRAMMAAGVISSPDVIYPDRGKELGYPEKALAVSRFLNPGDRNPDLNRLEKQLDSALKNTAALEKQPSISMSMHSWHTPEGLVNLDKAYARLAGNPDWWYCNQNEFGAYRYEALNTVITKKTDGRNAVFTVSRVMPLELGANVPLWFTLSGAKAETVSSGTLRGDLVELPHSAKKKLPARFGLGTLDSVKLALGHSGEALWTAKLENKGTSRLDHVKFTFRFPPRWNSPVIRRDSGTVSPGKTVSADAVQKGKRNELYFRYGRPYYAVQADYVKDGVPCRLYAELEEPEEKNLPMTGNESAGLYKIGDPSVDFASLSVAGEVPEKFGLKRYEKKADALPGVLYPGLDRKNWKNEKEFAVILDFKPLRPGKITLETMLTDPWQKCELWFNGKRLLNKSRSLELAPQEGVNRLALRCPTDRSRHFLLFNGEKEQSVTFLPLTAEKRK